MAPSPLFLHRARESLGGEWYSVFLLPSTFTASDIDLLRSLYDFPAGLDIRAPTPDEPCTMPGPGEIAFFEGAFECGLRLPLHPDIVRFLSHHGLCPSRLSPSGWATLIGFFIFWRVQGFEAFPTVSELLYFFGLSYDFPPFFFSLDFKWCFHPPLVVDVPPSPDGWSQRFFFVSGDSWEPVLDEGYRLWIPRSFENFREKGDCSLLDLVSDFCSWELLLISF